MVRRWGCGYSYSFLFCLCCSVAMTLNYLTLVNLELRDSKWPDSYSTTLEEMNHRNKSVTVFIRMAGKLKLHRTRFYCDYFRSAALFWPPSFGKTVVLLDEESEQDHAFAKNVTAQIRKLFPDRKLEMHFESLPQDQSILIFNKRRLGYSRQLWSSFFIDLHSNDSIIAWMDSDTAFITPVTEKSIFNGTKLRMLGCECPMRLPIMQSWANATEALLGVPMVANFMTYFPVYLYRDTFTHCREHILKRFSTSNFEEAFKKFYHQERKVISPVNIIISYAWFFEKDRYDWNFHICSDLNSYNRRFPSGHAIGQEHIANILSEPQTAFHVPYTPFLSSRIRVSYCLSHRAAGNSPAICANHSVFSLRDNLVLFNHNIERVKNLKQTPCAGNNTDVCLKVLECHYNQVGLEIKKHERKIDWRDVEAVEKLAGEADIACNSIK